MLTLRFSGACAPAVCATPATRAADRMQTIALAIRMKSLPAALAARRAASTKRAVLAKPYFGMARMHRLVQRAGPRRRSGGAENRMNEKDGRRAVSAYRIRVGSVWYWVDPAVPPGDLAPGD